jgi:hypothetical protein
LKLDHAIVNGIQHSTVTTTTSGDATAAARPSYRGILLAEERSVTGTRPALWLFRQLTGGAAKHDDTNTNSGERRTGSLAPTCLAESNVALVRDEHGNYVVQLSSRVQVRLEFPRLLTRLFPVSLDTIEQQGSASVE